MAALPKRLNKNREASHRETAAYCVKLTKFHDSYQQNIDEAETGGDAQQFFTALGLTTKGGKERLEDCHKAVPYFTS
jgi:hypothetical protein